MSTAAAALQRDPIEAEIGPRPPDHTQLPDKDESVMETYLELPQAVLLTTSLMPVLRALYPDGRYAVGGNSGIYWDVTDPPLKGAICPDWFLIPGVDPLLVSGVRRRSYVLWKEHVPPLIVVEFVSGDGAEERDRTPLRGKFWIYEQAVHAGFYAIFDPDHGQIELHQRVGARFRPVLPNALGHLPVEDLGVALGTWDGKFQEIQQTWLRWYDAAGKMLLTGEERAERLAAQLRALGVEPEV